MIGRGGLRQERENERTGKEGRRKGKGSVRQMTRKGKEQEQPEREGKKKEKKVHNCEK